MSPQLQRQPRKFVNPWTIIGWMLIAGIVPVVGVSTVTGWALIKAVIEAAAR